jgi:hypothetical protein
MIEWSSFFLLQLHLQAAYLLVQFGLQDFLVASPLPTTAGAQFGQPLQQLTLSLA